jgi:hypothetical protein
VRPDAIDRALDRLDGEDEGDTDRDEEPEPAVIDPEQLPYSVPIQPPVLRVVVSVTRVREGA